MKPSVAFLLFVVLVILQPLAKAAPNATSSINFKNPQKNRQSMAASKPAPSTKDVIEALRKKIPAAQTMSEANGVSIPDKNGVYFELTRLEAAAKTVPCDTIGDCKLLMQYLEDEDLKIRYIAATALERTLKTHPHAIAMGEIDGRDAIRHKKLVDGFEAKIEERFNQ